MYVTRTIATSKKLQLFIILLTCGMDFFHLGIVYPIFAQMASDNGFIYALLIGAFPFGQCIGAPLLGRWSDIYGRGRLLKLTVAGSAVGMALCALGVFSSQIGLILAGRLLGGVMGANLSIAYAAIADLSTQETKVKNLALIPLTISTGFALGPLFVSQVAHLALWIAAALSICNWGLLWFFTDGSQPKQEGQQKKSFTLLKNPKLWAPVVILFAMISANLLLVQFIGPFGVHRLNLGLEDISWVYVNISIAVAIGHLLLTRKIPYPPHRTLPWSLLALAGSLLAVSLSSSLGMLHLMLIPAMLCCAVAYTNAFAHLSNHADANEQGQVMGIGVSVQCLAEWIPALAVGSFAMDYPSAPMISGAVACLLGFLIFWRK